MRNYILIGLLLLLYTACSNSNKENEENTIELFHEFPKTINVQFQEIREPPVLPFVVDILILDDVLVSLDLKADTFFRYFDFPSLNYIGGFIRKGIGPGEEASIVPHINRLNGFSFLYRSVQRDVKIVALNDVRQLEIRRKINIPHHLRELMFLFLMNNKVYGYDTYSPDDREYIGFDLEDNKIFGFGPPFPKIKNLPLKESENKTLFTKVMASRGDGERFAALYDKFPLLRVYDKNGDLICEKMYQNNQIQPTVYIQEKTQLSSLNETTINYLKIKETNRFIYGLYAGKTHGELETQAKRIDDFCHEIHVWDWNGKPVARLLLDRNIYSFAVSSNDSYLIGTSLNHDDVFFQSEINILK